MTTLNEHIEITKEKLYKRILALRDTIMNKNSSENLTAALKWQKNRETGERSTEIIQTEELVIKINEQSLRDLRESKHTYIYGSPRKRGAKKLRKEKLLKK